MEADGLALSFLGARVTDMLSPEGQATGNPDPSSLLSGGRQRREAMSRQWLVSTGLASPRMVAAGLPSVMGIITSLVLGLLCETAPRQIMSR